MNHTKKVIIAILCITFALATTSCASKNATGCPSWGKVKQAQTEKKSV